jgi:ADP-ribose pyrophosphatase YjhB (NUDIX family)
MMDLYVKKHGEDRNAVLRKLKRDWYDLDFRYLREHPGFRAFSIYEHASGFTNNLMEIFDRDAFDNRREYICGFYRGQHGELYREYPYLSPERADLFVAQTAESILNKLREALSMRKEKVTWEYSSGAVVYTRRHDQILFVLVQEMSGAYSFPKGHVEGNETEMDTARREIFEETGLRPRFLPGFMRQDEYDLAERPGYRKRVTYFLAEFEGGALTPRPGEIRQILLLPYEQALSYFEHESTRRILSAAYAFLTAAGKMEGGK